MTLVQVLTLLTAVTVFASFIWAIRRFFARPAEAAAGQQQAAGMKVVSLLGSVCIAIQVALIAYPGLVIGPYGWAGWAMFLAAGGLFWWAVHTNRTRPLSIAFSADEPGHLVRNGPYRWVRHPFYTSYLIAWLAGAVATRQPLLLLTALVMGRLYWQAARLEEAKFARSSLAREYDDYARNVGMFTPRLF